MGTGIGEPVIFGRGGNPEFKPLSNFHRAAIVVDSKEYATVEHYFQACKAMTEWEHEKVRSALTPKQAKKFGRALPNIRPDWERAKVDVMLRGLLAKFRQHHRLRLLLFSTGERPIHEASPYDAEWGWMDGHGRDLLGKLLMKVRTALREEFPDESGGH